MLRHYFWSTVGWPIAPAVWGTPGRPEGTGDRRATGRRSAWHESRSCYPL